jgi:hypothetical protein
LERQAAHRGRVYGRRRDVGSRRGPRRPDEPPAERPTEDADPGSASPGPRAPRRVATDA